MSEKTERAIKQGQSTETGKIGDTRRRKKREKKPNLIGMFIRMSSNMFVFFFISDIHVKKKRPKGAK
jgi:hypothetical protein